MTAFFTYLLKVALCSGLLTGYYYLALRNRIFHQWNRFYLLSTVLLSLTIPLLTFTIFHPAEDKGAAIQLLQAVGTGDEYVVYVTKNSSSFISLEQGLTILYVGVSLVLFATLLFSLLKVAALVKKHTVQKVDNIQFINADVKGTPFSFFHYIFWNPSIDLQSENGNRIFRHELTHVRERHSLDKLLMQIVLILFWCNPFFWLIRYELRMIHEFIADRKALEQQDASALAAMILQAAYPTRYNQLINSFFHQPLKRRIYMLAKNQSPRVSYISRILFIPLAATLVLAFSVRTRPVPKATNNTLSAPVQLPAVTVQNDTVPTPKTSTLPSSFTGLVMVDGKEYRHDYKKIDPNTIQSINVLKGVAATNKYGNRGKNGVIEITLKKSLSNFNGLVMVDGKEYKEDIQKIDPNTIQSMNVLKDKAATDKYGDKGMSGVIEITLKPSSPTFTQVETEAQFPGGVDGWREFLIKNLNASVPVDSGASIGTYTVIAQLLIEQDGTISEIKTLTHHGFGMEEEVVRTLKRSPRWIPAQQNGRTVRAYRKQPITFVIGSGDETKEPPVTLRSGATLTVAQLQSVPFSLLIKPETGDYKLPTTNTAVPATELTISGAFTIGDNKGDVHEMYFSGSEPNERIKRLVAGAASGDIITIDKRKGITTDGKEFKMPSLVYFIK